MQLVHPGVSRVVPAIRTAHLRDDETVPVDEVLATGTEVGMVASKDHEGQASPPRSLVTLVPTGAKHPGTNRIVGTDVFGIMQLVQV